MGEARFGRGGGGDGGKERLGKESCLCSVRISYVFDFTETSEVGPGDLDKLTRSDGKVSRIEEELGDPMPKLSRRRQRYSSSLAAKVARENERLRNLVIN